MEAEYSTHEIRIKRLVRIFSVDTERWGDDDHDKFLTPGQQLRPLRSLVLFAQGLWPVSRNNEQLLIPLEKTSVLNHDSFLASCFFA